MRTHNVAFLAGFVLLGFVATANLAHAQTVVTTITTNALPTVAQSIVMEAKLPFLASGDLKVGMRGEMVKGLQGILLELGYLQVPASTPLGYFGPLTKSALARLQSSLMVQSTGYYGPLTRAALSRWIWMTYPNIVSEATNVTRASPTGGTTTTTTTTVTAPGLLGYWYNNQWYPATTMRGGGYYSPNPALFTGTGSR